VDVAALVRQLGSEDFGEREAAMNRLAALTLEEPPAELLAALKSPDPEVRDRAAKAVQAIRLRSVVNRLPRGEGFARRGEIDLFVAAAAAWDLKADDARLWEPALEVGRVAIKKTERTGSNKPRCPSEFKDFPTYRKLFNPRLVRDNGIYSRPAKDADGRPIIFHPEAIQASGVADPWGISHGIVLSRGPVRTRTAINFSLILATGDVTSGDDIHGSVVICDGDVTVARNVGRSLVIARGNIKIDCLQPSSTLIAVGSITVTQPNEVNPFNPVPKGFETVVQEKEPNPLGFITFFELSRVGLEVKVADGAVRVSAVAAGKTCEKAGVKAGDTILEVNGKKPADAEALRRLLRDALAVGDAAVKLQRGNDTLTIKLALPE
jgi:hypothetical protein